MNVNYIILFQANNIKSSCETISQTTRTTSSSLLHEATAIQKKSESLLTLFARCHSKYNSSAAVEDTEIDVLGTTKTLRSQIFYFTCMSFWDFVYLTIALIRDDVTKISRNVKPRPGGDRFAWFVDVLGKIFRCSCFSLFVRNASMVYCLWLYKLFRHGNQKVLASLTAGEQRTAFQMACKNSTNEHAS